MRYLSIYLALLLSISPLMADDKSEKILDELSLAVDNLGRYEVQFEIVNGGDVVAEGEYLVDQDLYRLLIASQEIYGDREYRYTVDHVLKEVVMESIDSSLPMVIANPARAFSGLNRSFDSEIVKMEGESIYVELTPKNKGEMIDSALLELDSVTKLPSSAKYVAEGEKIVVRILSITQSTTPLIPLAEISLPNGYEKIDIR